MILENGIPISFIYNCAPHVPEWNSSCGKTEILIKIAKYRQKNLFVLKMPG